MVINFYGLRGQKSKSTTFAGARCWKYGVKFFAVPLGAAAEKIFADEKNCKMQTNISSLSKQHFTLKKYALFLQAPGPDKMVAAAESGLGAVLCKSILVSSI